MKRIVVQIAMLILLACLWPAATSAHGGGTPRLTDIEAGPYRLYVWSSPETPRVGEMHITIGVTQLDADGAERPADANVTVTLTPGATAAPLVLEATRGSTAADVYYEGDTKIPAAGTWQITVRAEGEAGVGEASYQQEVLTARRVIWLLIGGVALALVLVILASRLRNSEIPPTSVTSTTEA